MNNADANGFDLRQKNPVSDRNYRCVREILTQKPGFGSPCVSPVMANMVSAIAHPRSYIS
jgi:hypothetical protein